LGDHAKITLTFNEPEGFDKEEYPLHATVRVTARFNGIPAPRQLPLSVLIKPNAYRPNPKLLDEPQKLKITSREPVKGRRGQADTHVRLLWDGKDHLITGEHPKWKLSANLIGHAWQPDMSFSDPLAGRFSLLISPRPDWQAGQR